MLKARRKWGLNTEVNDYLLHANYISSRKWTFTSVPSHIWDGEKKKKIKGGKWKSCWVCCSSASPGCQGRAVLHSLHSGFWKNWFPGQAQCGEWRSEGVPGSPRWARGQRQGSVECRVLGVCARTGREPLPTPTPRAAGPSQEQGFTPVLDKLLLSCFVPALPPARISEFSSWIGLFLLFFPCLSWLAQWIFADGFTGVSPLRICWVFCPSLNMLLKYSCAVWRLWDLTPGEAEQTNQHHPAGCAISGFKSTVLLISITPETKRTTQDRCLAKEISD